MNFLDQMARDAFEGTAHCRDEAMVDGLYADPLTAINWLVFMSAFWASLETRKGLAA